MSNKKKNIIFILIDGARYDFVTENSLYLRLFGKSLWFNRIYTTAPYTIGSMHAMFTGLYPKNNGVNGYLNPNKLKPDVKIIPQYLKENNYFTLCNIPSAVVMANRGFDVYEIHDEYKFMNTEEHIDCMKRHEDKIKSAENFFLYFHYSHIHTSLSNRVLKKFDDFSEEYFNDIEENRKIHASDVLRSGEYLESMLEYIKQAGLLENTDVWIASDHGVSCGDKLGEKAYGIYLFEYTLHTFLIKYGENSRMEDDEFRCTIDTLPMIFKSAELEIPKNLDGMLKRKKITKKLFREVTEYAPIFLETGGVGGPFPSPEKHNIFGVMTENRKLIHNKTIDKFEEYDYSGGKDNLMNSIDSKLKKMLLEYER
ncbi:TPA: hypothetical protein DCW38_00660 [candidate division WOR-3 bacterium]|jgi:arylsulfatase A-like enzyme|uniref:Sulfatase N-terminal domain-containing protein n=1 Tax=candidate division WOR-3 bacterium TaxID=2052148 RepID=A0A350H817_UNCW3|nr:hypothetical protein [candidate division WOR-3 bacterium]